MDTIDYRLNYTLLNPHLPESIKDTAQRATQAHPSHSERVWLMSSGTSANNSDSFKLMTLTHGALKTSAQAVNQHLKVTTEDRWLNVLPLFHVGGLAILYRAQEAAVPCSQLWSQDWKWSPIELLKECQRFRATLLSLVPTQIFDIVQMKMQCPPSLRAVLVGGGALNYSLYRAARVLGWPLLPSFGMTEVGSQIATAPLSSLSKDYEKEAATECSTVSSVEHSVEQPVEQTVEHLTSWPLLARLPHLALRTEEDQILSVSGPSLFDGYYPIVEGQREEWVCPIDKGWYRTQDRADINLFYLRVLSRADEVIKILGENVNLGELRKKLEHCRQSIDPSVDCALVHRAHERYGFQLGLVGQGSSDSFAQIYRTFNQGVLPFERLSGWKNNIAIPRTPLGKIQYALLKDFFPLND